MTRSGKPASSRLSLSDFSKLNVVGRRDCVRAALVASILGAIFFLYNFFGVTDIGYDINRTTRSVFFWLFDRWRTDWRATWYAHSHWVPLVSLLLIWRKRKALTAAEKRTCWTGLAVIILSLLVHWAGAKAEQTRLSILSLIGLAWGIPLFACGWPTARILLFPCAFLVFSLPLNFFDAAAYPLRVASAAVTSVILSGLGFEITRAGSAIFDTASVFSIDLADAQSSIFAVTAIAAYATLLAYLMRARIVARIAVAAVSIPLLVTANIIRGILIMLMAAAFGNGAGEFAYRYLSGPVTVIIAFGGVSVLALWLHRRSGIVPSPEFAAPPVPPRAINPLVVTLAVLLTTAAVIPTRLDVAYINEPGVNLELPGALDEWNGGRVLFCHNPSDAETVFDPALEPGDPCPTCGEPLQEMSIIERRLLPTDTVLSKTYYTNDASRTVFFTIVLSGKRRASIHRPEVCLVGPNSEIDRSVIHTVELDDGSTLDVKILEMINKGRKPDGTSVIWTTYYAYWFAGRGRETPHHIQRMAWMAADRLFFDKSYRWAYISVSGLRKPGDPSYRKEIDRFLSEIYPHLKDRPGQG